MRLPKKAAPGPGGSGTGLQPTKVGLYFTVLVMLVAVAAINTGNNGLFLVTALMLASLIGASLLGAMNLRGLAFALSQHGEVFVGRPFHLGLRASARPRGLAHALLAVRLELPGLESTRSRPRQPALFLARLAAGEEQELRLEAVARKRGRYQLREVRVASLFPLGLFDKGRRYPVTLDWVVFPEIYPRSETRPAWHSGHGSEAVARPGQGQELYALRPYQQGDDPRAIHWKQSARQGLLISQQRQHEELKRLQIVLDNATGPLDPAGEKRFEQLISEAATAALDLLDEGAEVALFTRDHDLPFGKGLRHRLELLEALALLEARPLAPAPLAGPDSGRGGFGLLHLGLGGIAGPASEGAAA